MRRRVLLTIADGLVGALDSLAAGVVPPPRVAAGLIDLSHCTIVPPLVDCSVSLARSPSLGLERSAAGAAEPEDMSARHLYDCHSHGVLGVADSGGASAGTAVDPRRSAAAEGLVAVCTAGPIPRCGPAVDCDPAGGGDFLKIDYSPAIEETPPAPFIPSALSTPLTPSTQSTRLGPDELTWFIRRKGHLKAVVVANGAEAVAEALAAGCDAIEQGYDMGVDNLRRLAAQKVLWVPSLLRAKNALDGARGGGGVCCRFSQRYVAPGKPLPGGEELWRRILAGQLAQVGQARKLGVAMAVGTGAGSPGILHGESVVEEMKLFAKAGCSLPEIMRYAAVNGAEFFGLNHLGPLAPGRPATFLVARGSAGQLPRKLAYLENIFIAGAPSRAYRKNPFKTA